MSEPTFQGGREEARKADRDHWIDPPAGAQVESAASQTNQAAFPPPHLLVHAGSRAAAALAGPVLRNADGDNGVAPHAWDAIARASSSAGAPLPDTVHRKFESSLGADLSGVRVHTGPDAEAASASVQARAFTVGPDVYFGAGQYNPSSPAGEHLLAHEVAHTVQQGASAPRAQFKLEVSQPGDAHEAEADRAADAMVQGQRALVSAAVPSLSRLVQREAGYGDIQGAGDEAEAAAKGKFLSIDTASVTADAGRVGELVADIDKHQPVVQAAERWNPNLISAYGASTTNAATKANLQVLNDKLDVSGVDTAAFASQYHVAYADYQRLIAESAELLAQSGVSHDDAIGGVTAGMDAMGKGSLKMGEGQVGLQRFRAARANLNTAAQKMNGEVKFFRGAAQGLQGQLYSARAKAAAANGADAKSKLDALRAEIDGVAKGVGMALKIAAAASGMAGGGGATGALADGAAAGNAASKKDIAKALYKDADALSGGQLGKTEIPGASGMTVGTVVGGDPVEIVEGLVKVIGEQINKDKLASLQQQLAAAAAEEKTFNAASEAATFAGYQATMEGAAAKLATLVAAFQSAKTEMAAAGDALMAELAKGGKRGKDQARVVVFVTDADRFLAQVTNAITTGENQQSNIKSAADDRKKLRGTTSTIEAEPDRVGQSYWRAYKSESPGMLWGKNQHFRLERVSVTFQQGSGYNDIVQGGAGSVEGAGGAQDAVASKLEVLKKAKAQIEQLQQKAQGVLGLEGPGLNA